MGEKPTYKELEQRIKELEKEFVKHKKTEEALRLSEERYRTVVQDQTEVISRFRADGTFTFVNDVYCRFFNKSSKELLGKQWQPVAVSEDLTMIEERLETLSVDNPIVIIENRVYSGSGEIRWMQFVNRGFFSREGQLIEIQSVGRDINDRKLAEEKLAEYRDSLEEIVKERTSKLKEEIEERKQAEEALRVQSEIAANMSEGIYLIRISDGVILYTNPRFEQIFGYGPGEMVGKPVSIVNAPTDMTPQETVNHIVGIMKQAGVWRGEIQNIKKDGTPFWCYASASLFEHPEYGEIIVSVHTDITERKLAEEALRESEMRYRMLFEKAGDAIFIMEAEGAEAGKIVDANPAAAEMHGYTADELLALNIKDLDAPDAAKEVPGRIQHILEGEWIKTEIEHRRKDGTVFPVEFSGGLLELGNRKYILGFDRDATERKLLEAQLERAQKMEAIGILAGGVAHDLNNILAGLVSYPDLLLLEIPEDSPLRDPILTIQKSGQKAATIVEDLLTLARRGVAVTEVVNLNDIISEYVKSPEHGRLISFHAGVHVKTELEEDLLNTLGSPAHLSKIVMNLVSNAAEAMPEGGEISISTENQYIDKPVTGYDNVEEGDYAILRVSDTGVGFSKMDRERIFEPFYTKKVMGRSGTGLGMTVVWGTVKDHNGYIDIKSAKGKGTTFTIYFPVTRKELPKDKALVSIEDYMGKGESVLVIDDVKEQREIASRMLKKLGYSVTLVSSGEEAVDYLKDNSADLLVLDMAMDPGIDGFETYKRILEFHPNQKAIIASGFAETKRVKEAQRLGAGAYVKKPFLLRKIGPAVRDELER